MYTLPTEIVQEIGLQLSPVELKDLSATSRSLRAAMLPLIAKDVSITSMGQLKLLAEKCPSMVELLRNLTITLNIEFFDAWTREQNACLASILSRSRHLQSLTFQASNCPYDTPWNRLSILDDAMRGVSLGLESSEASLSPLERLRHLELQTVSPQSLEILLSRTPNLQSLSLTLPDGLSDTQMMVLLTALRHVPALKELSVGIAVWECCQPGEENSHIQELLKEIALRLPELETLDLRSRSYDIVDGVLSFKCVEVEYLSLQDFASVLPLFQNLRVLRLPLQSRRGDATVTSTAIANQVPSLETISWMRYIAFQSVTDEYTVGRNDSTVSVTRLVPSESSPAPTVSTVSPRHPRRGFSLFDSLFKVVQPDKPSILSDIAVSFTALMVVSSMVVSPFLVVLGF
ncbi:hypothetical protein FRB99_000863 [Tulasnella sp. 403]|nr:hypothetical protein FRB99_000863 [Tulasnella sp. 403]